jgi:hypothetical protein
MGREQVKRPIKTLMVVVLLFGLVSPVMGIGHPVEPFQKAKALALMEGIPREKGEKNDKMYILVIKGWGSIVYTPATIPEKESIMLNKGTPSDNSGVGYDGRFGKYSVSRRIEGGKPEITGVDWSVAMDIAYEYLREIEAARSNK